MSRRAHYEAQIKRFRGPLGRDFNEALDAVAYRAGLDWFTEDQLADIREELFDKALRMRRSNARSRAHYAAQRAAS